MSDDNKNPFSEKTVVQSRVTETAATEDPVPSQSNEKTVVFAQSNLKETFDARTVVRISKPTAPAAPVEEPVVVLPAVVPPNDFEKAEAHDDSKKAPLSREERRAQRAALDRKTRTMIAAFAALCVLVVMCFLMAFGGPKPSEKTIAQTGSADSSASQKETNDFASEAPATTKSKTFTSDGTTTDVLMKFDRAAQKAQEHALDYSRSSSGF